MPPPRYLHPVGKRVLLRPLPRGIRCLLGLHARAGAAPQSRQRRASGICAPAGEGERAGGHGACLRGAPPANPAGRGRRPDALARGPNRRRVGTGTMPVRRELWQARSFALIWLRVPGSRATQPEAPQPVSHAASLSCLCAGVALGRGAGSRSQGVGSSHCRQRRRRRRRHRRCRRQRRRQQQRRRRRQRRRQQQRQLGRPAIGSGN
jgi:hypothetical protein